MGPPAALPTAVRPPSFALAGVGAAHRADDGAQSFALPVLSGDSAPVLGAGAEAWEAELGIDLLTLLESEGATGEPGEVVSYPLPTGTATRPSLRRLLLVGVGAATLDDVRRAGATLGRATFDQAVIATSLPDVAPAELLAAFVAGVVLGSFGFVWRSGAPAHHPVGQVLIESTAVDQATLDRAVAVAEAAWLARTLATVPSNLKNPPWLADQARDIAARAGLGITVWDEKRLASEGFGGILAVGRASTTPPRLIRLDYTPPRASRRTPTIVLVGKGITFDSGGLSIKPGEAMRHMKRDMTGGGVVLATMSALAAVGCPVKVVGLVPTAENAISGDALRPGDVIEQWGGRTTEVTNTDAEGRLVLADALAYATETIKPAAMVDIATLTGAVKIALGQGIGGYFATDDALAASIEAAGKDAGEPLWRLPLMPVYEEKLASKIADADNAPGGPGAIMAALFLQHFVGQVPWAHLDIASVGDVPDEFFEWTVGPSGFGVRALLGWLGSPDPLAGVAS